MNLTSGDRAVKWIGNLTLTEDFTGQPFVLRPWQADIPRKLYGTLRPNGLRQIRRCLLLLPRKQAKTQLAAGMATYDLLGSGREGQQVLVAASDREQASHLYRKVWSMIEADPYLCRQVVQYKAAKRIEVKKTGNILQVLSSDGRRLHGHNPSTVIIDEFWTQKNRDLYDALTSAFGARRDPLTVLISTQGNRRDSLIYQEYDYACKVRDGIIDDPEYLPIIYEAGDSDWHLESTWFKAMPALDDYCNLDFIRSEYNKAKEIPSEESKFRQFYMNELVASGSKWVNRAKWQACGVHKVDPSTWGKRDTYWGLDGSWVSDITALVGVCRFEDGHFEVVSYFWIPKDYAQLRDKKGHTQYDGWHRKGYLNYMDGGEIDFPHLEAEIPKILRQFKVKELLADPHGATSTLQRLKAEGFPVVKHRQGWRDMSAPIKYTEVLISKGLLHHGNNPVMNWMADNTVLHRDSQLNYTFDKLQSADKIDGIVSMVMGVAGASTVKRKSVYGRKSVDELLGTAQ